jgi:hypothetical protein
MDLRIEPLFSVTSTFTEQEVLHFVTALHTRFDLLILINESLLLAEDAGALGSAL